MNKLAKILLTTTMAMGTSFAALADRTSLTINGEVVGAVTVQLVDADNTVTTPLEEDGGNLIKDLGLFDALGVNAPTGVIGTSALDGRKYVDSGVIYSQDTSSPVSATHSGTVYLWGDNTQGFGIKTNITGGTDDACDVVVNFTGTNNTGIGAIPTFYLSDPAKPWADTETLTSDALTFSSPITDVAVRGTGAGWSTLSTVSDGMEDGDIQYFDLGIYVDKTTEAQQFTGIFTFVASILP